MTRLRILRTKALFVVLLLVFALSAATMLFVSAEETGPRSSDAEAQDTYYIYLPAIAKEATTATSSATLIQPPAVKQLGGMMGVLAAGFAMGIALIFWREPEDGAEEGEATE